MDAPQLPSQKQHQQNHDTEADLPAHPLHLTFPTLEDDGSIPDLTAHQRRPYPPTPPAALSTLGILAKMAGNEAPSEAGSFHDSQYDMIDDLSDTSNDDHETASITSHDGASGQLTPEYAQSEADDFEERAEQPEHNETVTLSPAAESFVTLPSPAPSSQGGISQTKHQMKAENDLIDSYTSEDLETPRQSTMTNAFASTYHLSQRKTSSQAVQTVQDEPPTNHILFVSDRDMPVEDMDVLCAKAASCLDPADPTGAFNYHVKRLPTSPSGLQSSAQIMRGVDGAAATLQHCIGAETRSSSSYKLLIFDSDEEHSSFFTIGQDAKIDLPKPTLAIFYLDTFSHGMAWFDTAYEAMNSRKIPILVVRDSDFVATKKAKIDYEAGEDHLTMDAKHYMAMDRAELKKSISLLVFGEVVTTPSRISKIKAASKEMFPGISTYFKFAFNLVLAVLSLAILVTEYLPPANPAADLTIQREALTLALDNFTNSTNITNNFNVEQLMTAPPANCTQSWVASAYYGLPLLGSLSCPVQVLYQAAPPNHVVVSLQDRARDPKIYPVKAFRSDGHTLNVSQAKLVPGVYHLALDTDEAYGTVNFTLRTKHYNATLSNNFGNRLLQRKTYEKASTDLSKIVSKDVSVMRHAAMDLTEKVSTEIGAGLWATKNVTSQLALYVTRDIQLAADTAVSVFTSAAKAGNKTASNLGKDFVLVQKGISNFGGTVSNSLKSKMQSARKISTSLIRAPVDFSQHRLALARERAPRLLRALQRSSAKEPTVPKKDPVFSKFESLFGVTPKNELSEKRVRTGIDAHAGSYECAQNLKETIRKRVAKRDGKTDDRARGSKK